MSANWIVSVGQLGRAGEAGGRKAYGAPVHFHVASRPGGTCVQWQFVAEAGRQAGSARSRKQVLQGVLSTLIGND